MTNNPSRAGTGLRPEPRPPQGSSTEVETSIAQRFFDAAVDMLCVASVEGYLVEVSSSFAETLGYGSTQDVLSRPFLDLVHPDDREATLAKLSELRAGRVVLDFENRYLCADGSFRWLQWRCSPMQADGLVFSMARDVTSLVEARALMEQAAQEHQALEEQLLHSQKLEGIGRLAGGVAHDFNNILTVILGNAELAEANSPQGSPVRAGIRAIREAGERAAALTAQLLTFARRQITQPHTLDLNALVQGVDSMLRRILGENIELSAESDPELWSVEIDPGQLEQVLMNLAVNANDAMPGGGRLTIATHNTALATGAPGLPVGFAPGEYVELVVADTGAGMDEAVQGRAFEPFYTTKELGKGTGLGLSTCHGIIAQHGGHIELDSALNRGTAVRILLPRARTAASEERAEPQVGAPRGTETVLLVEDEELVCELAEGVLRSAGYTVLAATTGEQALELAAGQGDPIDILVTDVVLPKSSGKEVAERLQRERPDLAVLFTSGYADSTVGAHGLGGEGLHFLQKPYTPSELANRVRSVLDGLGEGPAGS